MEESRRKRYVEKIKHIERRIDQFEEWKDEFFENEKSKLACYKAMQEIIEGCFDIVAMIVKDFGEITKDDYSNVDTLEKIGFLNKEVAAILKEANGLRNRIVHEYNGLSDEIAFESFNRILPKIEEFIGVVKGWLKEKL